MRRSDNLIDSDITALLGCARLSSGEEKMSMATSLYVVFLWGVVLIIALGGIGFATYSGLSLRYDLLFWRKAKLFSSFLGVVGLALLLVNLEKTVRDTVALPSKAFVLGLFYDTKFLTKQFVTTVCSHENDSEEAKRHCSDATNLDNHLNPVNIWDLRSYAPINYPTFWETNRDVSEDYRNILRRVNDRFSLIRMALPAANETSFLSENDRIALLVVSAILVSAALSGSIGEAAYQLALTKKTN
jgi:hypothetical protein